MEFNGVDGFSRNRFNPTIKFKTGVVECYSSPIAEETTKKSKFSQTPIFTAKSIVDPKLFPKSHFNPSSPSPCPSHVNKDNGVILRRLTGLAAHLVDSRLSLGRSASVFQPLSCPARPVRLLEAPPGPVLRTVSPWW